MSVIGFVSWANGCLGVGGGGWKGWWGALGPIVTQPCTRFRPFSISKPQACVLLFVVVVMKLNWIEFYYRLHCKRSDRLHPLITNMISIRGGHAVVYLLCPTRAPLQRLFGAESIWGQQQVFLFFNQLSSLGWIYNPILLLFNSL